MRSDLAGAYPGMTPPPGRVVVVVAGAVVVGADVVVLLGGVVVVVRGWVVVVEPSSPSSSSGAVVVVSSDVVVVVARQSSSAGVSSSSQYGTVVGVSVVVVRSAPSASPVKLGFGKSPWSSSATAACMNRLQIWAGNEPPVTSRPRTSRMKRGWPCSSTSG